MKPVESFRTARMIGERLRVAHLDLMVRLNADPQVARTLGGIRSAEETRAFMEENLRHWERRGYGLWVLRERDSGRFVGRAGIRDVEIDRRAEVELAYALMPEFWNRGLATEAARALIRIAFDELGLAELVAFTLADNRASRRVMEKIGMIYERDLVRAGLPHVLYRIRRAGGEPARE
jgi:[ribosomal protein S5]-alanine N-acetyltransferase